MPYSLANANCPGPQKLPSGLNFEAILLGWRTMSNQAGSVSLLKTYCVSTWMSQKIIVPLSISWSSHLFLFLAYDQCLKKRTWGIWHDPFPQSAVGWGHLSRHLGDELTACNLKKEIGWKKRSVSSNAVPRDEQAYQTGCAVLPSRQADGDCTTAFPRSSIPGFSLLSQHMLGCRSSTWGGTVQENLGQCPGWHETIFSA